MTSKNRKTLKYMYEYIYSKIYKHSCDCLFLFLHNICLYRHLSKWVGIAQSVYRLAMAWTFRWIPVGARFSTLVLTGRLWAHTASYTTDTVPFSGVKRPVSSINHPPPYSTKVKGRVELHLYFTSEPSWPVIGWILPFFFHFESKDVSLLHCLLTLILLTWRIWRASNNASRWEMGFNLAFKELNVQILRENF
jgi:hypothetical protein